MSPGLKVSMVDIRTATPQPHTGYTLLKLEGMLYYMKYGTEKNAEFTNRR
jgi:hypothetical protein